MGARDEPLGGQEVIEGVMMRSRTHCAVAVRRPGAGAAPERLGPIEVESFSLARWLGRHRLLRLAVVRGAFALAGSLAIGFKALQHSMNAQLPDGEEPIAGGASGATVRVAMAFAIGLFFVIPVPLALRLRRAI